MANSYASEEIINKIKPLQKHGVSMEGLKDREQSEKTTLKRHNTRHKKE